MLEAKNSIQAIVCSDKYDLGKHAAQKGALLIREAISKRGKATIIIATGASQFEMLSFLIDLPDIDWSRVTSFHLDEYVGMSATHPASFRKYLKERFVDRVPIGTFHYVNGEGIHGNGDVEAECDRIGKLISAQTVDVAFVGIGENGHLAFNDPPANFETEAPFLVVDLDKDCRKQQLGEGWFKTLDEVPKQAISMSIRQIMKSKYIICSVPDQRKAKAVQLAVEGKITPQMPSSILQKHDNVELYLNQQSASLLKSQA